MGRRRVAAGLLALALLSARCSSVNAPGACSAGDADGNQGGSAVFRLTVDDSAFSQRILAAQNRANVTLTLKNSGTKSHDFVIDCMPTPNANGCSTTSCFPDASSIAALSPGMSATTTFQMPQVEGIYVFRSDVPGDTSCTADGGVSGLSGQFIVQ